MPWLLYTVLLFAPYLEQTPEEEAAEHLSKVRRIYIAILTGGDAALQIRDLLMTSLHNSKQFIITEDEDKADATLKGAGDDNVFTDNSGNWSATVSLSSPDTVTNSGTLTGDVDLKVPSMPASGREAMNSGA